MSERKFHNALNGHKSWGIEPVAKSCEAKACADHHDAEVGALLREPIAPGHGRRDRIGMVLLVAAVAMGIVIGWALCVVMKGAG